MHTRTDSPARDTAIEFENSSSHKTSTPVAKAAEAAGDDWVLAWGGPVKRGVPIPPLWD